MCSFLLAGECGTDPQVGRKETEGGVFGTNSATVYEDQIERMSLLSWADDHYGS